MTTNPTTDKNIFWWFQSIFCCAKLSGVQLLCAFFGQFYNSLCRNLPRRYVLPLNVDKSTPLDQNLVTLQNYKATAKMTKPGEVGSLHRRRMIFGVRAGRE